MTDADRRAGAEELGQRRREVPGRHPVQVHQRQHLGHLRALATPRRHDGRAEPAPLAGLGVDPAVVDSGRLDFDLASGGDDGAGLGVAIANDQAVAVLVELPGQGLDVAGGLHLDCGDQHPPGALADDLVQSRGGFFRSGVVIGDYCQHRRSFPPASHRRRVSRFGQRGRYAAPSNGWSIHRFWL
jgi:hypothetical protein